MAHRHKVHARGKKHREDGGELESKHASDAGMNPHITKAMNEKGASGYVGGDKSKPRLDRKGGGKGGFNHNAGGR